MRLLSANLLIFALLPRAFSVPSATVTLYNVQVPPKNSLNATLKYSDTISAVGVNSDGMTTYREILVVSEEILVESSSTFTLTDDRVQTTVTAEIVADASGYVGANTITNAFGHNETITLSRTCKFEGTTAGLCIADSAQQVGGGPVEIKTTTYSGSLNAYYTVTETAAIPGQTQSSEGIGSSSRVWKIGDLINGLICLVVLHTMIGIVV